jgi:hypothetical protein
MDTRTPSHRYWNTRVRLIIPILCTTSYMVHRPVIRTGSTGTATTNQDRRALLELYPYYRTLQQQQQQQQQQQSSSSSAIDSDYQTGIISISILIAVILFGTSISLWYFLVERFWSVFELLLV